MEHMYLFLHEPAMQWFIGTVWLLTLLYLHKGTNLVNIFIVQNCAQQELASHVMHQKL